MYTAVINCGHGKQSNGTWDPGTTYQGKTEAALMMPITKAFVKYARSSGIKVYSDSDSGNDKNIITGVAQANRVDADVFVSIHCDYYKAPSGTLPLYAKGSSKGKKLAKCLNTYVKSMTGIKTRGVTARTDLYELNATEMPACIYEAGSIKADGKEWDTAKECDEYGKALAKGLCKYFGIPFKEPENAAFKVEVIAKALNIRKGPGTGHVITGVIKDQGIYTIVDVEGRWGKLKSGMGWIHLDYTKRL